METITRRFKLNRNSDITGISGVGYIAIGIQWPDYSCELFWLKTNTIGHYKNIEQLQEIHCYNGNAVVQFID